MLQQLARRYSSEAYTSSRPSVTCRVSTPGLQRLPPRSTPSGGCSGLIPAKIARAVGGAASEGQCVDDDPVQNDWNGSAKVARLAIAESIGALADALRSGRHAGRRVDSPHRGRSSRWTATWPRVFRWRWNSFDRGFDEPDVAAGALTRLAPFEPRRRTVRRRLQLWGWRLRRRVLGRLGGSH